MEFNFSVDELVVIISALRTEYRRCCEGAIIARRKSSVARTDDVLQDFLEMARGFDARCADCTDLYKKIINKDILEDL